MQQEAHESFQTAPVMLRATFREGEEAPVYSILCSEMQSLCGFDIGEFSAQPSLLGRCMHAHDRAVLEGTLFEMRGLVSPLPRNCSLRWLHRDGSMDFSVVTVMGCLERVQAGIRCFDMLTRWIPQKEKERSPNQAPARLPLDQDAYFFEKVVETVNDGILVNAPDGVIIFVNDNLAGILGYKPQELLGSTLFDLMDEEGIRVTKQRLANRKEGVEEAFDFRFVHRDGSNVWTHVSAKPFVDEGGAHRGSLVAISDISERKRAEASLHALLEELEQRVAARTKEIAHSNEQLQREIEERKDAENRANAANRAKSSFLANMSHELRTPLSAIIGYSQLLEEEFLFLKEERFLPDVIKIQRAGQHLLSLISDILDISKIEAGKMDVFIEPIWLPEFLDDVGLLAEELCKKNGNQLILDLDDAPNAIACDRLKLRQILFNFLSNAAKFTKQGKITMRVAMTTNPEGGERCLFSVADQGIGIEAKALYRLFQPFEQVDSAPSRQYEGAGLGLAISKEFCELLGGSIHVESEPGVGSTFSILMPLTQPEGQEAPYSREMADATSDSSDESPQSE